MGLALTGGAQAQGIIAMKRPAGGKRELEESEELSKKDKVLPRIHPLRKATAEGLYARTQALLEELQSRFMEESRIKQATKRCVYDAALKETEIKRLHEEIKKLTEEGKRLHTAASKSADTSKGESQAASRRAGADRMEIETLKAETSRLTRERDDATAEKDEVVQPEHQPEHYPPRDRTLPYPTLSYPFF